MNLERLQICCVALMLLVAPATVAEDDLQGSGSKPPASGSSGEISTARFEGYLWKDADGNPLSFQSDEAIEEFLRTASVVSSSKIGTGVTQPRKLLLAANDVRIHAVFKDVDVTRRDVREKTAGRAKFYRYWRDWHLYDVAAYHVDRLFGLDRVPPAVRRKVRRKDGSVKIWLEGTVMDTYRHDQAIQPPSIARWNQQRQIMHIFDNLVANRDSNLGNILIDGSWRLWFIDCGRCFGESSELLYPETITHCDRGLWNAMRNLDEIEVRRRLSPYLTRYEIDAMLARRDKVVAHLEELIDKWGEEHVLFDLLPTTEPAPWAEH